MGIIGSWWGSRRESDHWGDLGVDGCIIMGCISGEFAVYSVLVVKLRERVRWGDVGLDGWIKLGWVCWVRGFIGSCWGNRRERNHWGDLGVDGWMVLGWISRRWDVGICTGLGWPRIEIGGGRL